MPDAGFQYVKLPDGSFGRFRADAGDAEIRSAIEHDFPGTYKPSTSSAPAPKGFDEAHPYSAPILGAIDKYVGEPVRRTLESVIRSELDIPKEITTPIEVPEGENAGLVRANKSLQRAGRQVKNLASMAFAPFSVATAPASPVIEPVANAAGNILKIIAGGEPANVPEPPALLPSHGTDITSPIPVSPIEGFRQAAKMLATPGAFTTGNENLDPMLEEAGGIAPFVLAGEAIRSVRGARPEVPRIPEAPRAEAKPAETPVLPPEPEAPAPPIPILAPEPEASVPRVERPAVPFVPREMMVELQRTTKRTPERAAPAVPEIGDEVPFAVTPEELRTLERRGLTVGADGRLMKIPPQVEESRPPRFTTSTGAAGQGEVTPDLLADAHTPPSSEPIASLAQRSEMAAGFDAERLGYPAASSDLYRASLAGEDEALRPQPRPGYVVTPSGRAIPTNLPDEVIEAAIRGPRGVLPAPKGSTGTTSEGESARPAGAGEAQRVSSERLKQSAASQPPRASDLIIRTPQPSPEPLERRATPRPAGEIVQAENAAYTALRKNGVSNAIVPTPSGKGTVQPITIPDARVQQIQKSTRTASDLQKRVYRESLQPALAAWKGKLGEAGMRQPPAEIKAADRPEGFKADNLHVRVPGGGDFWVRNNPAAIARALKNSERGFAIPKAAKPAAPFKMRAPTDIERAKFIADATKEITRLESLRANPKGSGLTLTDIEERIAAEREAVENVKNMPAVQPGIEYRWSGPGEVAVWAKVFWDKDVAPTAKRLGLGTLDTFKLLVKTLMPRVEEGSFTDRVTGLGVPSKSLDAIMKLKGERDHWTFLMEAQMHDIKKFWDSAPREWAVDFLDKIKRGERQASPKLEELAQAYRKVDDWTYMQIIEQQALDINPKWAKLGDQEKLAFVDRLARGVQQPERWMQQVANGVMEYKQNHLRIFWKKIPGGEPNSPYGLYRRPLSGTRGFLRQATLDDISEGIARGGEPLSYNPQTLFELGQADALRYITARKMWRTMKDDGAARFLPYNEPMPEGYVELHDNIARAIRPVTVLKGDIENLNTARAGRLGQPAVFKDDLATSRALVESGRWVIEQNAGRLLNNYLSHDYIRETAIGRGLMGAKNFTTALELSFSPFHFVFETIEAMGSQFGIGLAKLWNEGVLNLEGRKILEGAKDIATSPLAPIKMARTGGSVIRYVADPLQFEQATRGQKFLKQFPEIEQMVDDLFGAGGKLAMHEDYRINTVKTFNEALKENNVLGATLRAVPALGQWIQKPLFEIYIPRLKLGRFIEDYGQQLSEKKAELAAGKVTRSQLARRAWDRTENIFGEMNFDNLFWNRTMKSGLQLALRSVTWWLGNLRASGGAIPGELAEAYRVGKAILGKEELLGQKIPLPRLHPNVAWLIGVMASTATLATIIQKTATGTWPQDIKDLMHPRIGGTDSRGKPSRISMPTYFRTIEALVTDPSRALASARSSVFSRTNDVLANRDYRGTEIYDPHAPLSEKASDIGKHLLILPMTATNWQRAREATGSGTRGLLGAAGFTRPPQEFDMTPAEKLASELRQESRRGVLTPAKAREFQRVNALAVQARNNSPDFEKNLAGALQRGEITSAQAKDIRERATVPYLVDLIKDQTLENVLAVWEVASPQERDVMRRYLIKKASGIKNRPMKDQAELRDRVLAALSW